MRTIYKYHLDIEDEIHLDIEGEIHVDMPSGAKVLTIQEQHGMPCAWALVETENELRLRRFRVYGTGEAIHIEDADILCYVATCQVGRLVWHFFEVLS